MHPSTEVNWSHHISACKNAGGSIADYCRSQNINYKHFIYRMSREKKLSTPKEAIFLPITFDKAEQVQQKVSVFKIEMSSQGIISGEIDANHSTVKSLLSTIFKGRP